MTLASNVVSRTKRLQVLFKGVLRAGLGNIVSSRERRQALTANAMGVGMFAVSWPYIFFLLASGHRIWAGFVAALCLSYLSPPLLNARGYHLAARVTPLLAAMSGVYVLASILGPEAEIQVALFMITGWAYNLFDVRKHPVTLSLLAGGPGVLYALVEFGVLLPVPHLALSDGLALVVSVASIALSYVLLVWVLWRFYAANQHNETRLETLVTTLREEVLERKRSQARAETARFAAERAARAKSEFLAIMSHELRTPLNGVVGSADLLADTPLNQEQQGLLRLIQSSSRFLLSLVSNVLDFAAMESGKVHLASKSFDVVEMFEEMVGSFRGAVADKGLPLWLDIAPEVPRHVRGDEARMRQLIGNLIDNAIKFTERGRVLVKVRSQDAADGQVRLTIQVCDTGAGIPDEHRESIFERFSQQDTSLSRRHAGVGLGLSICRLLARAMGGEVVVAAGDGYGSVFEVELTLQRVQQSQMPPAVVPKVDSDLRCAVCCHNAECRLSVVHGLQRLGVECVERLDESGVVDAVFVDMPLDNVDLAVHVKSLARNYGVPSRSVILLTSQSITPPVGTPLRLPFTLAELVAVLPDAEQRKVSDRVRISARPPAAPRDLTGARILVAEDNLVNQKVLLSMLRKLGVQADAVIDGQQAVEAFVSGTWVAILMDIQMPVMDGLAATAKIRSLELERGSRPIPVIAVSANAMPSDIERGFASGVTAYLTKPLQLSTLHETLSQHLSAEDDDSAATRH